METAIIRTDGALALIYTARDGTFKIIRNGALVLAAYAGGNWEAYSQALQGYRTLIYTNRRW